MIEATVLGTGSPVPTLERAGTAIHVSVDGDDLMIDCGPRAVYELVDNGFDPGAIEDLLFTHHHVDHNGDFFNFAIAGWSLGGRESLTLYGPPGTDRLVEAMYDVYEEDIEYRKAIGYPGDGIDDIEYRRVDADFRLERPGYCVSALPVEHSIETYAFRVDDLPGDDAGGSQNRDNEGAGLGSEVRGEDHAGSGGSGSQGGGSFVFSGDTKPVDDLVEFAAGADVLVHDCCIAPRGDGPDPGRRFVWEPYANPMDEEKRERLARGHSNPTEAAAVAADAGVGTLVLTHLLPYRDTEAIREIATSRFDGEVIVAEDGLTVTCP